MGKTGRLLEDTLNGSIKSQEKQNKTPTWVMRQAGRYLPEYRELRKQAGSFLDLAYNPEFATEVTLQPLKRFDLDAAILFSDILVIPHALGMDLEFVAGEGPKLDKLNPESSDFEKRLKELENNIPQVISFLTPVMEAVKKVRKELTDDKTLIGFCGAPWTVSSYMLDNHPSKNTEITRSLAFKDLEKYQRLLDILVEASAQYLCAQAEAGANVLQIFDSWASQVPHTLFEVAIENPLLKLCKKVKEKHPEVPIILFPRGVSESKLLRLCEMNKLPSGALAFEGLGLDYTVDMAWAAKNIPENITIQGNLDPTVLLTNPQKIKTEAEKILNICAGRRHIFNLGHGIIKETPVEHMQILVETVKNFKG